MNNDIESQLGLRLWIIFCWIGIADPRPKMLAHNFTNEPFLTAHLIPLIKWVVNLINEVCKIVIYYALLALISYQI